MIGRIEVASSVGVGTSFTVDLKAAKEVNVDARSAQGGEVTHHLSNGAASQGPLLLYVEDNPANLQLVKEIVGQRGDVRQMSAPDAQLGIELARAHRPEVILMDINLPGLSGKDALNVLLADPLTAHIPVVALTANAMVGDIARGLAAGFFRYVTKPIEVAKLNEAIDSALSVSQARRAAGETSSSQP